MVVEAGLKLPQLGALGGHARRQRRPGAALRIDACLEVWRAITLDRACAVALQLDLSDAASERPRRVRVATRAEVRRRWAAPLLVEDEHRPLSRYRDEVCNLKRRLRELRARARRGGAKDGVQILDRHAAPRLRRQHIRNGVQRHVASGGTQRSELLGRNAARRGEGVPCAWRWHSIGVQRTGVNGEL